jgi:tetratricopeptide (TPR) repeat protein
MRIAGTALLACIAAACAGVSLRPEDYTLPEARALDAQDHRRLLELELETRTALAGGHHDTASDRARAGLTIDPRSGLLHALLGRALAGRAQRDQPPELTLWREAERELRIASELAPDDPEVALAHAWFLATEGHLTAAIAVLEPALVSSGRDPALLRELGRLHYELGEERAALPYLVRLLELAPDDADAQWRLAQAQLALAAIERDRDAAEAVRLYRAAAVSFAQYRVLRPDDHDGALGEAHALAQAGLATEPPSAALLAEALAAFEAAARLAPRQPAPWHGQAVVRERLGSVGAAIPLYREALARDAAYLPAQLGLVAALAANGDRELARAEALRALALPQLEPRDRDRLREFLAR